MNTTMLHSSAPREELAWVIADIHQKGMAQGTGGNFSTVVQTEPLRLLMSPSSVDKGKVLPSALIEVDRDGRVVQGEGKASAETLLHLELVATAGAKSVLHTHSVLGTLLSMRSLAQGKLSFSGYEMLKGIEGVTTHETTVELPVIENAQDMQVLSARVRTLLKAQPHMYGFLVAGHGLYAWGDSLFQARRHMEIFEFLMELTYRNLMLSNNIAK
ncbi:MAG: methylthioribulose-1-phosphate dehydratase MtnB [Phormidesmis priestleyi Ana]|uniref:Methylthioribulose-1-phosphate dehydratase n=1 Tax=Phormidesmis priestleyi Ana TaxID=1666911 RepID=A0A0N8KNF7_9CYAN|nr:MAG: methylthioribulose-1-phosphate dehydratase MtnB [Phormidesmis priestleyi Ana]